MTKWGVTSLAAMLALTPAALTAQADVQIGKGDVKEKPKKGNIDRALQQVEQPNKQVRIIVELEEAPTVTVAKNRGQLYKQLRKAERAQLEAQVEKKQKSIQKTVKEEAPIEVLESFTTVFNGFSAEVEAKYIEQIAETDGVKAVYMAHEYEAPKEKPQMTDSTQLVQAQQAWQDYGVRGEGMVVAVVDSGVDPYHRDFKLTNNDSAELTRDEVNSMITDGSVHGGQFFTDKVPFGYNYMDGNTDIIDVNPETGMHGMHVAGTVGANGDENGIKGVAPEAQILAMRVFGGDPNLPTTYADIYIKAIDDAIKLGADVINMSLGSTAGYVDEESAEAQAITRATDSGVLVAISAGNSDMYGSDYFYPFAQNPDYGLVGSPSLSANSLSVASFENTNVTSYQFSYAIDGEKQGGFQYLSASDVDPLDTLKGNIEVVDAALGRADDFTNLDVAGKVALISRGENTFIEKTLNAQQAGAVGVLIYNNAPGTLNMATDASITIPQLAITQSDGLALKTQLDAGHEVTIAFNGEFLTIPNALAGKMSDFSSWGVTPSLDFKPEITAPGGNIFSTLNDNKYGINSGTSMASPHVAGGAALLFERIDEQFGVTGTARTKLAKQLLMNTSEPVKMSAGDYVSPRRQGAGLMQLADALANEVIVTSTASGEGKVALKEIEGDAFTFTLEAKNYGDEAKTYDVDVAVQVDALTEASGFIITAPNIVGSDVVTDTVDIATVDSITVPANSTAQFTVTADIRALSDYKEHFTNGFFVDGFVTLTDPNEEITGNPNLVVPFTGFNGEWDDAPIFDAFMWEDDSFWGATALADETGTFINGGGAFDTARFGFSPNGDGIRDKAIPVYSLLRNAKQLKVEIVNNSGNVVRTIRSFDDARKHYSNALPNVPYTFSRDFAWDGLINGKAVQDGQYSIRLSAVIDYEGAQWQSIDFPIQVDTVAPTATATLKNNVVTLANVADTGTGADYWHVFVDGKAVSDQLPITTSYTFATAPTGHVTAVVTDAARNTTEIDVTNESTPPAAVDKKKPVVRIDTPDLLEAINSKKVAVSGTLSDESDIKIVTVNGEKATFTNTTFTHTLSFKKDGVYDVKVKAIDAHDNAMEVARKVLIDTTKPKLSIKNNYKKNSKNDTEKVNITISDNYDSLRLTVNGSELYQKSTSVNALKNFSHTLAVPLTLEKGKNTFTFELEDIAGNISTQTITITRK